MRKTFVGVIVAALLAVAILVAIISDRTSTEKDLKLIRSDEKITEARIAIATESGMVSFEPKEPPVLDSLSEALRTARENQVQTGGAFYRWANVTIHKNRDSAVFMVQFSAYNGKYLEIGNRTFDCPYLINLVNDYAQTISHRTSKE